METIDIVEMLASHELIRIHKVTGNWYTMYCPFHSDGQEKKPSFGILLKDEYRNGRRYPAGMCNCFACKFSGTLVEMVTEILKRRSISQSGYDWLVEHIPGFSIEESFEPLIPSNMLDQINSKFAVDYVAMLSSGKQENFVSEEELASYRFTVPYMYERRLTDDIIEKFDVGYDANWIPPGRSKKVPCITFPVHDAQGRTLFICRRSIAGKLFNYPTGVTKPVYGLDMIPKGCKSIILAESILDALTAWVYGYVAVAFMGTGNSYQIQQLKELGVSEYVICTDGDEAGRRAVFKLKNSLKSNAIIWVVPMPDGKDINDLTKQEFDSLYALRE